MIEVYCISVRKISYNYELQHPSLPENLFSVEAVGVDWAALEAMVDTSSMPYRAVGMYCGDGLREFLQPFAVVAVAEIDCGVATTEVSIGLAGCSMVKLY